MSSISGRRSPALLRESVVVSRRRSCSSCAHRGWTTAAHASSRRKISPPVVIINRRDSQSGTLCCRTQSACASRTLRSPRIHTPQLYRWLRIYACCLRYGCSTRPATFALHCAASWQHEASSRKRPRGGMPPPDSRTASCECKPPRRWHCEALPFCRVWCPCPRQAFDSSAATRDPWGPPPPSPRVCAEMRGRPAAASVCACGADSCALCMQGAAAQPGAGRRGPPPRPADQLRGRRVRLQRGYRGERRRSVLQDHSLHARVGPLCPQSFLSGGPRRLWLLCPLLARPSRALRLHLWCEKLT